jgi:CheY-like chemotaxis protein
MIAVTGWGQAQDREQTREAGFDFHLTKPVGTRRWSPCGRAAPNLRSDWRPDRLR